ncbi:MAG: Clp protease ClpP [Bacteroidales bacterium]|nr:Clp protease ClpP [Bacteroidales bacterium]
MATIKVKGTITTDTQASFYRWFGIDACSPGMIEDGLNEAAGEDVELEIASPGGTVVAGYEIYALLKKYEGKVTAHITWACSAATLIACACDEVLISEAGVYMIHNTQGAAEGDYRAMNEEGQALRALNDGIINAYEKKTGLTREKLQSLMDKSTYMSPQKAIELGFADGYMTGKEEKQFDITSAAAGLTPQIPEENVASLMAVKKFIEEVGGEENALATISQKTDCPFLRIKQLQRKEQKP